MAEETRCLSRKLLFVNLATVVLACGLMLAMFFAERLNNTHYAEAARVAAQNRLALVRSRLEGNIHGDIQLVKGLVSVIAANPQLTQQDFARAARPLFRGGSHLRNIGAAPDMVIRMMYPLAGNEKAIGLDFRKVPKQFEAAERARLTRQIIVAGPLPLVQGGVGLVSRMPVYVDELLGRDYFWGLISAVIDVDRLYRDSGLAVPDAQLDIAIRGRDAAGANGEVFFGRAGVFSEQPVVAEVPLPQGSWLIAAVPRNGWPEQADNTWQLRLGFVLLAGLLIVPFIGLGYALRKTSMARARAESAQGQLSATLEQSPMVAVQWYDPDGRVLYWNHASELMYGWAAEEACGKTLAELIQTQAEADAFVAAFARISADGQAIGPTEYISRHRDGRNRIVSSTLFPIPNDGEPIFVRMDVDITKRKQAEHEALLAKDAAESASRAKSEFLTNISHELRTPLNAIIGFAQLLDMGELKPLHHEQQAAVGHIMDSGRHLLKLINEILDLARIESGKLDLCIDNVLLSPLIDEAVSCSLPFAAAKRITIQLACPGGIQVRADRSRVRQVLLNLLSNAVKYNREGGSVTLSCEVIGGYLRVNVSDTGMGIADGDRAKLFQPFQRLSAGQTSVEGTGIGLVVCKRLVEAMDGRIGFDSAAGVGSRFWIDLSIAAPASGPVMAASAGVRGNAADDSASARGRVLYIEDSPVNIHIMRHIFRKFPGVELVTVESAETGLALVQQIAPDLVLMDINLPGMSGLEALYRLKADPDTAAIPVIAVSAAAMPDDVAAGLEAGFIAYLTKPFDVPELVALVCKALNKG
ncbi:MAG: ATP-binding protein [Methylovulum sp.]|nr:ATP-binding protein [Methylovulum sp.]